VSCREVRARGAAPCARGSTRLDLQPLDSRKTLHCRRVQPQGVVCVCLCLRVRTPSCSDFDTYLA